jgi:ABC-type long-subunit fatty acid transport system fused permease/ATPase subunit
MLVKVRYQKTGQSLAEKYRHKKAVKAIFSIDRHNYVRLYYTYLNTPKES